MKLKLIFIEILFLVKGRGLIGLANAWVLQAIIQNVWHWHFSLMVLMGSFTWVWCLSKHQITYYTTCRRPFRKQPCKPLCMMMMLHVCLLYMMFPFISLWEVIDENERALKRMRRERERRWEQTHTRRSPFVIKESLCFLCVFVLSLFVSFTYLVRYINRLIDF